MLAFQKSWRSFSPIILCILAHCQSPPSRRGRECAKKIAHYMILRVYTVMVWGGLVEVWYGLGCFNGPHDDYANS